MLSVGDKVTRVPKTIGVMEKDSWGHTLRPHPMRGVVVYIHSKGRFHVVAFENSRGERIRETFDGV